MTTYGRYVIVGAGLAGAKAAETLRREGFDGQLVVLGDEAHRPCDRPGLSKYYLMGDEDGEKLFIHDEGFYADHGIDLRISSRVFVVDGQAVVLEGGEQVGFDRLLLATGARPRPLRVPGADLDGVYYLRASTTPTPSPPGWRPEATWWSSAVAGSPPR